MDNFFKIISKFCGQNRSKFNVFPRRIIITFTILLNQMLNGVEIGGIEVLIRIQGVGLDQRF